jgi:2-polyprenyl-6-methoxyphenol hydroxylase-like FAD-dependent oxidoreductase
MTPLGNELSSSEDAATIVITGGGIVGLTLALALKKHVGLTAHVYESSDTFGTEVGAGMGMYPNGLRVLRDIDPDLVRQVQEEGHAYQYRRWERHDGTEIMTAQEEVLARGDEQPPLESLGIRRWRLQKCLYEAAKAQGIPIHFEKETVNVEENTTDGTLTL